jgi:hypothetical protein
MLQLLAAVWAGCVIGVSFVATPIKFRARRLSYDAALEVGRLTYRAVGWLELVLLGAVLVGFAFVHPFVATWPVALVIGTVLVQRLWLLPRMDARVEVVLTMRGRPPPSPTHHAYIASEVTKVFALLAIGVAS